MTEGSNLSILYRFYFVQYGAHCGEVLEKKKIVESWVPPPHKSIIGVVAYIL